MADQGARDQLTPVTVLFVDISGSTTLYAERGDAAAFTLTKRCLDVVGAEIRAAGGRVLRQMGDGVLAVFDSAVAALRAAIEVGRATESPTGTLAREGVRVRSGLSAGHAVFADGDVYGDVANVAARLVGLAAAGEIFLSDSVYEALPAELRDQVQVLEHLALRNRPDPVLVYTYVPDAVRATIKARERLPASAVTMELTYEDVEFVIGPQRPRLRMGRDADNDVRVDAEVVSRHHADITLHGDRFTLRDHSTNGTYVCAENAQPLRVMRDELVLAGAGRIMLGGMETARPIFYRVAVR
jgi:class 3 adenylate cyclase